MGRGRYGLGIHFVVMNTNNGRDPSDASTLNILQPLCLEATRLKKQDAGFDHENCEKDADADFPAKTAARQGSSNRTQQGGIVRLINYGDDVLHLSGRSSFVANMPRLDLKLGSSVLTDCSAS